MFVKISWKKSTKRQLDIEQILMAYRLKKKLNYLLHQHMKMNMHACGHDFHMSIALGVLTYFVENPIDDNLFLSFSLQKKDQVGQNQC